MQTPRWLVQIIALLVGLGTGVKGAAGQSSPTHSAAPSILESLTSPADVAPSLIHGPHSVIPPMESARDSTMFYGVQTPAPEPEPAFGIELVAIPQSWMTGSVRPSLFVQQRLGTLSGRRAVEHVVPEIKGQTKIYCVGLSVAW